MLVSVRWPVKWVAKNCTKSGATRRTGLLHSPKEERGQTSREMSARVSVRLRL